MVSDEVDKGRYKLIKPDYKTKGKHYPIRSRCRAEREHYLISLEKESTTWWDLVVKRNVLSNKTWKRKYCSMGPSDKAEKRCYLIRPEKRSISHYLIKPCYRIKGKHYSMTPSYKTEKKQYLIVLKRRVILD